MLAAANVREHWRSFLAAFIAVAVGVGLIAAFLILYDSSRARPQPRLAGSPILVVSNEVPDRAGARNDRKPWSESEARQLIQQLRVISGVHDAIVDRSFYAQAFTAGAPVAVDPIEATEEAGHGWSSTRLGPYELVSGRAPHSDTEVAVGAHHHVAVGSTITVGLVDGVHEFTVSGVVEGSGFYFTDDEAERRDTGVTTIALLVDPGATEAVAQRSEQILGEEGLVLTGNARAVIEPDYLTHQRFLGGQLITVMVAMALFTTTFVVAATLGLAAAQRRREVGLLRVIGADAVQIRRMMLTESLIVGLLGSVVGCLTGTLAAPTILGMLDRLGVTAPDPVIIVSAWPLVVASGVGTGVAVLGAWLTSHTAVRVAPIEALQASRVEQRPMSRLRWVAGVAALTFGLVLAVMTSAGSGDRQIGFSVGTAMCFLSASALLAPLAIGSVARLVTAPFVQRSAGAGLMLVRAQLLSSPRRAASTTAPVILAVGLAVLISGIVNTMAVAYPAETTRQLAGQTLIDPGNAPGLNEAVVAENPVGRAPLATRLVVTDSDGDEVVIDGVGSRDPRWSRPGEAVLDTEMAAFLQTDVDDTVSVRFDDGLSRELRVTAVLPPDPARVSFVLSRNTVRQRDATAMTHHIFIPANEAPRRLSAGTQLRDAEQFALQDYATDARLTSALALMLAVLAVGYSGLAIMNNMAIAGRGRRSDYATLRSVGATTWQLMRFAIVEGAVLVAIGSALALMATLPALAGFAAGISAETATSVPLQISGGVLVGAVLGSLLVALGSSTVVTWRVLRSARIK